MIYKSYFINEFGNDKEKINLIPHNEGNYISFSKFIRLKCINNIGEENENTIELRFIVSFKFLSNFL